MATTDEEGIIITTIITTILVTLHEAMECLPRFIAAAAIATNRG